MMYTYNCQEEKQRAIVQIKIGKVKMAEIMTEYLRKLLTIEGMIEGEIESIIEAVNTGELTIECIEEQMPESVEKCKIA